MHLHVVMDDAAHRRVQLDAAAMFRDALGHPFVDHAGAAGGIGELIDERLVPILAQAERGLDRFAEREFLDPLGGEVGVELIAGDAPQLFAVRFEEHLEEPPAEAADHPRFEGFVVIRRETMGGSVRCT